MINTKLQNIIDTKSAIGNAIVNKGGTITSETPFFNYAAQIDGISTGTPQTIFAASDGSKWALTNVVNLTNVSNNVTYDFNRWQPANNSTSDPILNVGTVGANISGNIRIVQVNQVNIAQYVNTVATDINGAKYVGYNGYDATTNPTPTGNATFNRWLLNNSASGTVIFANVTVTNGGTFNGPNITFNETNLALIGNTASYGFNIQSVTTNNGFIYIGGPGITDVRKYHESNLAYVGNTPAYGGPISSITVNNGFIYVGGGGEQQIRKYNESTLSFVGNSGGYFGFIYSVITNNSFIFAGGANNQPVKKYHESNLVLSLNGAAYGNPFDEREIRSITSNNGFIYAAGSTGSSNGSVVKFHESNLANAGNTANYGGLIQSITTNNGFIYAGGITNQRVHKFREDNLAFVNNTFSAFGGNITSITTNNGFIYVGGFTNRQVHKYYEDNLAFVGNTANYGGDIFSITTNNGFIYAGGTEQQIVRKYQEKQSIQETLTFYTATKIKE
jgi:hypothetical protein